MHFFYYKDITCSFTNTCTTINNNTTCTINNSYNSTNNNTTSYNDLNINNNNDNNNDNNNNQRHRDTEGQRPGGRAWGFFGERDLGGDALLLLQRYYLFFY